MNEDDVREGLQLALEYLNEYEKQFGYEGMFKPVQDILKTLLKKEQFMVKCKWCGSEETISMVSDCIRYDPTDNFYVCFDCGKVTVK